MCSSFRGVRRSPSRNSALNASSPEIQVGPLDCYACDAKMLMQTITESPYLLSGALINPSPFYQPHRTVGQLPIVTSFVPSLSPNNPFRISIHSWEKPRASRTTEALMQPDDSVLFEVRVFFDNLCVAYVKLLPTHSCLWIG